MEGPPTPPDYKDIENSSFWFKVKIVLVAGVGFFTDAYDLFTINYVVPMLGYVYYYNQPKHALPSLYDSLIKASASWGNFFGQIIFGYMADRLGRKKMYGIELMIMIVATIGSSLAADTPAGIQALAMLGFWRFILGIGIGGDYPLSSVLTSEYASKNRRGAMIAVVFGMQGLGMLASALVALIFLSILKGPITDDRVNIDFLWRICLGVGVIPAMLALYFRVTIKESPRYRQLRQERELQEKETEKANNGEALTITVPNITVPNEPRTVSSIPIVIKANDVTFWEFISKWHNFKILLGCSMSWFTLDIAFYGSNLNQSYVLDMIGFTGTGTVFEKLRMLIVGNLTIVFLGTLPGYYFTAFFVDKWGRLPIQYMGFIVSGLCWLILATAFEPLSKDYQSAFLVIYIIAMFFMNFGPNSTTFIIPGECFPTKFRSTCHGISAAMGKLGAVLAAQCFSLLKDKPGVAALMYIFAAFMLLGLLSSFYLFETKGKTLEELENYFIYEKKEKKGEKAPDSPPKMVNGMFTEVAISDRANGNGDKL